MSLVVTGWERGSRHLPAWFNWSNRLLTALVSALRLQQNHTRGVAVGIFGVSLPKRHAEAGRVRFY